MFEGWDASGHHDTLKRLAALWDPCHFDTHRSAALEDGMSFEFGPPDIVIPSHELMGEMLLAAGRPAEILRPDLLESLFRARFEIVRGGERPATMLLLGGDRA